MSRARGYVTWRRNASEADDEWWATQPGVDDEDGQAYEDFVTGMLDGRDQAVSRKLGLPCPEAPTPEALAAAREVAT